MPSISGPARAFWSETESWSKALESCGSRMEEYGHEGLASLDSWFVHELPAKLAKQEQGQRHIDKEDLVKIMEWKLKRGRWRPKLLEYANEASQQDVQEASGKAFAVLQQSSPDDDEKKFEADCMAALKPLMKIKGTGPATASAVMTAENPTFPFMSDEAMEAALSQKPAYTVKRYVEYAVAMRRKAKEISTEDKVWTPRDIERAIYSHLLVKKGRARKRKRSAGEQ